MAVEHLFGDDVVDPWQQLAPHDDNNNLNKLTSFILRSITSTNLLQYYFITLQLE